MAMDRHYESVKYCSNGSQWILCSLNGELQSMFGSTCTLSSSTGFLREMESVKYENGVFCP
jgi:hypothetical protein